MNCVHIITRLACVVALGAILTSCEKVIDVDLNSENPQIVIEGSLQADSDNFSVRISKTSDYFEAAQSEIVSNATVVLTDEAGDEMLIAYEGEGMYQTALTPVVNSTYTLAVDIDGERYEASSFLPATVEIIGLEVDYIAASGPIEEGYQLFTRFVDDGSRTNYYRIKHKIDGVLQNGGDDLRVYDDRLFDGGEARLPLIQKIFDEGEVLEIELIHFDEASYEYFNALTDIISQGQGPNGGTAAPGNPNSNWSNGALGYFSASSSSMQTIVVQ